MPALLVCTVGGAPEPIVASIKALGPERVLFIVSSETAEQVEGRIVPLLAEKGASLTPGRYEKIVLDNAQDLQGCVQCIQREAAPQVERWRQRGAEYAVVADMTGGTKCMTAALALVARRWPCRFSYVGGSERTKGGVGIVVTGKEQVLHTQNPWDSLGFQAADDAIGLFDRANYEAAEAVLEPALRHMTQAGEKNDLAALKLLCEAYGAWDLFDHGKAASRLKDARRRANDLRHLLPTQAEALLRQIDGHVRTLEPLLAPGPKGHEFLLDLCANAQRCAQRGRYDDAVARLYRLLEALAQVRLRVDHGLADTEKMPLERVPEPLRGAWASRSRDGTVHLGLQDDYDLLMALGDPLGSRFEQLALDDRRKSPLSARNKSILAHGFSPVARATFDQLWSNGLALAGIDETALVRFPRLGPIS